MELFSTDDPLPEPPQSDLEVLSQTVRERRVAHPARVDVRCCERFSQIQRVKLHQFRTY
jgi:hypothetical protein